MARNRSERVFWAALTVIVALVLAVAGVLVWRASSTPFSGNLVDSAAPTAIKNGAAPVAGPSGVPAQPQEVTQTGSQVATGETWPANPPDFAGDGEGRAKLSPRIDELEAQSATLTIMGWASLGLALLAMLFSVWLSYGNRKLRRQLVELRRNLIDVSEAVFTPDEEQLGFEARAVASARPAKAHPGHAPMQGGLGWPASARGAAPKPKHPSPQVAPARIEAQRAAADSRVSPVPTRTPASQASAAEMHSAIPFVAVRALVQNGASMIASEYRAAADQLGRRVAVAIENGKIQTVRDEDDGVPRPLMALFDDNDLGLLVPSHAYVKNFGIAHLRAGDTATTKMQPFFDIEITKEGSLRYDLPCDIILKGGTISVIQKGRLSGFTD